ncbi:MAG TPA: glyoxalase [Bacteroidales bacterium]|nr:MAG: glyoxalase [Bacteroidetes bacterium GWE2_42_24]OFY30708.1 MAG: glyoxalase [Bacteroidetes bacterium GWF2_43_11]HAQ65390.1 glyoxalase [Bacteroidales bacterium]HBZ65703.1 glyoxalase [Bacteroidales bacterium]
MKYICPLLVVSDIQRSREFYENLLNQKVKFDFGENVTYDGDFAIHLQTHYEGLIDNKTITYGSNNFELYFENNDLEQIVQVLKDNHVPFVHEIREQPWRQKVVRILDPDKHIIEIGESLEHLVLRLRKEELSAGQIAAITSLPIELVNQILGQKDS